MYFQNFLGTIPHGLGRLQDQIDDSFNLYVVLRAAPFTGFQICMYNTKTCNDCLKLKLLFLRMEEKFF